jgi:hypothetical protein
VHDDEAELRQQPVRPPHLFAERPELHLTSSS